MTSQNVYRLSPVTFFYRSSVLTIILLASIIASDISGIANAEDTFYSIQLGYFLDNDKAKDKVDDLNSLGHNAFMVDSDTEDGGKIAIVYIEKFNTKQEAETEAKVLKELNLITEYSIQSIKGTPAPAPSPAPSPAPEVTKKNLADGYYLQVRALKEKNNAQKKVDEINKTGREAFYRYEAVKDKGSWYRVYTGGYTSKTEALKDAQAMKKSGLISAYYIKAIGKKAEKPKPVMEKK